MYECTGQPQRVLEALKNIGPEFVRKGMRTFDQIDPFRKHQLFDTCFIAHFNDVPDENMDDWNIAEKFGLDRADLDTISAAHYEFPEELEEIASKYLEEVEKESLVNV